MKFIGIKQGGGVMVGLLRGDRVTPLAPVEAFYEDLAHWTAAAATTQAESLALAQVQLAPALPPGARVLCVGLNYKSHAEEGGREAWQPPEHPAIFGRWTRSLIPDGAPVPALDERLDWECELGVVIGRKMAAVDEKTALAGVFGYAPFNDISARSYQRHNPQWTPGKNMDSSGPTGTIVTADEVGDPGAGLHIETRVNGQVMQSATTADMIFSVGQIIAYLTEVMTLYPGDFIATGTTSGVGNARKPPIYMKPGDVVEVEIEKVGKVTNPIVDASRRAG